MILSPNVKDIVFHIHVHASYYTVPIISKHTVGLNGFWLLVGLNVPPVLVLFGLLTFSPSIQSLYLFDLKVVDTPYQWRLERLGEWYPPPAEEKKMIKMKYFLILSPLKEGQISGWILSRVIFYYHYITTSNTGVFIWMQRKILSTTFIEHYGTRKYFIFIIFFFSSIGGGHHSPRHPNLRWYCV